MNPQMRQILHSIRLHKVHIYLTTDKQDAEHFSEGYAKAGFPVR